MQRDDEIGALAQGLDHMRAGIAEREQRILKLAYEDPLTQLPNRAQFGEALRARHRAGADRRGSRWRSWSWTWIASSSSTIRSVTGSAITCCARSECACTRCCGSAGCVARLGGDEFALLVPALQSAQVIELAQRIIAALERPIIFQDQPLDVGTSIGIALFPEHAADAETLVRNADIAMYVAKRNKIGYTVYDPKFDTSQQEHLSLLGELRHAVEHGELRLYYQPKVSLDSSTVHAAEALIRWVHPTRGLVPPGLFIPFAEHTGYIKVLTRWVLAEAIRQCGVWRRDGLQLQVSVNISARDLMNRDLPEAISALLSEHAVPAIDGVPGDYRKRIHGGPGACAEGARASRQHRAAAIDRRLRHRLFIAELHHAAAGQRAEDRSLVRVAHDRRSRPDHDRALDHRARAQPGTEGGRRRRGGRPGFRAAARAGLRRGAGLLHESAVAGGGISPLV